MLRDISLHILDLAQNSVTAGARNIKISVSVSNTGKLLTVEIKDDGCGMSPEFLAAVEDPFTTGRKTRKVGMGIPFFKLACEQAGGSFNITSAAGQGTALKGTFETENIDRLPLGDLGDTIICIISSAQDSEISLEIKSQNGAFKFSTLDVKEEIGDMPITEYEILQWIKEFINENVQIIFGGVLNEIIG